MLSQTQATEAAVLNGSSDTLAETEAIEQIKPEEMTGERLLEVLEEVLPWELPQPVGRYQFTHALIQETLPEELSVNLAVAYSEPFSRRSK